MGATATAGLRGQGKGEKKGLQCEREGAVRAPFEGFSPIILSEVPTSLGEGALSSHSGH